MSSRSEEKQKRINLLMQQVPDLPQGFNNWIRKSALKEFKFIFYKKIKKTYHGVCSSCKQEVNPQKATHNEYGRCPECNAKVQFKSINKAKYYDVSKIVSIMQKMDTGKYVVRYFKADLVFKSAEDTSNFPNKILKTLTEPTLNVWEGSREIISHKKKGGIKIARYEELWSWQVSGYEWKSERGRSVFFNKILLRDSDPYMYKRNFRSILKEPVWKYSALNLIPMDEFNITEYLIAYEKDQVLELLVKLKWTKLLREYINYYNHRYYSSLTGIVKSNQKRLGLSANVFNRAKQMNLGCIGIEFLVALEDSKRFMSDNQIKWVLTNGRYDNFIPLLKYTTAHKAINYISKTANLFDDSIGYVMSYWGDYLNMSRDLGIDLGNSINVYPRDLNQMHSERSNAKKAKVKKELNEAILKQYNLWHERLAYSKDSIKIDVAFNHKSLIDESTSLKHCVGNSTSYAQSMAEGKILILMVTKENYPYSTIEFSLKDYTVIQHRAYDNADPPSHIKKFVDQWMKEIVTQIHSPLKKAI